MKSRNNILKVRIIDAQKKGIENAEVILKSQRKTIYLNCIDAKGNYTSDEKIPKGDYTLTVSKKPFVEEKRRISYKGGAHSELFFLIKKDTPFYYRGKVKTPFKPFDDEFAVILKEVESKKKKGRSQSIEEIEKKHNLKVQKCGNNIANNGIYIFKFPSKAKKKDKLEVCQSIEKECYFHTFGP